MNNVFKHIIAIVGVLILGVQLTNAKQLDCNFRTTPADQISSLVNVTDAGRSFLDQEDKRKVQTAVIFEKERREKLDLSVYKMGAIGNVLTDTTSSTGTLVTKCLIVTASHAVRDPITKKLLPNPKFKTKTQDGKIIEVPLKVIYAGKVDEGRENDYAIAIVPKLPDGEFLGQKLGWINLENTSAAEMMEKKDADDPNNSQKKMNFCVAGFSTDIEIGKGGREATVDKKVELHGLYSNFTKNPKHEEMFNYYGNIYSGGSGGPIFKCPVDKVTGEVDLSKPKVVGIHLAGSDKKDLVIKNKNEALPGQIPVALSSSVIYKKALELTSGQDPCVSSPVMASVSK